MCVFIMIKKYTTNYIPLRKSCKLFEIRQRIIFIYFAKYFGTLKHCNIHSINQMLYLFIVLIAWKMSNLNQ